MKKETLPTLRQRIQSALDTMELIPERIYDEDRRLVAVLNQLRIIIDALENGLQLPECPTEAFTCVRDSEGHVTCFDGGLYSSDYGPLRGMRHK